MQDLKNKPSISLHTAYQVWYVCFQGNTRLLQHTNSQLETFWTLQVRVVILDDGLYLTTWYIRRTWRKTSELSQATDKLYHIMLYTSPWSRFELTASVVIGTDCLGICKSNYHTISTTMVSFFCRSVGHADRKFCQLYSNDGRHLHVNNWICRRLLRMRKDIMRPTSTCSCDQSWYSHGRIW